MLDQRVATIETRLAEEKIPVDFVLVSDHGMTSCGPDRVVILDDFIDLKLVQVDFDETVAGLRPAPGVELSTIRQRLSSMPHVRVYRAEDLPPRFHVDPKNPRVPPVWILPDEGWQVLRGAMFARLKSKFLKGQHGYDPAYPSMHGIFIASGPDIRAGVTVPDVENVHIYNLLCALAGLKPAPNDGDDRLVKAALRSP
jgi:predicted AlkP superfamily pyrophosphatase or phosphodiesterase